MNSEGHAIPGCDGEWIDVSSLSSRQWTCPKCRATIGNPEDLIPAPPPEAIEEPTPGTELVVRWSWLLLATLMGGALALALFHAFAKG